MKKREKEKRGEQRDISIFCPLHIPEKKFHVQLSHTNKLLNLQTIIV